MNKLYTSVTKHDLRDERYMYDLQEMGIGFELALLTTLSDQLLVEEQAQYDLDNLKRELEFFLKYFERIDFKIEQVRVHQPGGYMYAWFFQNGLCGFEWLRMFIDYCGSVSLKHHVLHTPFGQLRRDEADELADYREKLACLASRNEIEVEEIIASNNEIGEVAKRRLYHGRLYEELLSEQAAQPLLDVHECGSVFKTMARLQELTKKGLNVSAIHLQKNKHKFLTQTELSTLLESGFQGALINEGFLRDDVSFTEYLKTKGTICLLAPEQKVTILKEYLALLK
ncbi:MAG: hypothetical protein RLZ12_2 [Bacillota bacterium]